MKKIENENAKHDRTEYEKSHTNNLCGSTIISLRP